VTVAVGAGSATDMISFSVGELFASEKKLLGCIYGSADVRTDFHRILALWQAGRLDLAGLVSREIGLDDINQAFAAMDGGEVVRSVIRY
jgi:S-(hydroxymethyl)glutathione dehydrogenase/alcohol dehydrogenase